MAKIVLVAQKLNPTVLRLAQTLRQQQHQITLLTSQHEDAVLPDGIEMMAPFRRWSWREGLKVAPVVFSLSPQIIHLVLDEDRLKPAQIVIALLAKAVPHCVLTTSLLHIRDGLRRRNPVRYLLQESDIVTCPSVETLGALRGLEMKSRRQGRGILPPTIDLSDDGPDDDRAGAAELLLSLRGQNYLVIPFTEVDFNPLRPFFLRLAHLASHRQVVLLGSQSGWPLRERKKFQAWMDAQGLGDRWRLTGMIGRGSLRRLLSGAESLVLAGLQLSPLEITEYFLRALQAGATVVLDDRQSMIHPNLWRNGENCWILSADDITARVQDLLRARSLRRPPGLPREPDLQRDLIDAPLNELNRLYNKALSHKHIV